MSKHTPGPWIWDRQENLVGGSRMGWDGKSEPIPIVQTDGGYYGPYGQDRSLIAAAPDLLSAGKEALSLIERILQNKEWGAIEEYADELRAAIDKAEG